MAHILIDGNEAVVLGALAAGCRFFAGYPITPATTLYQGMLKRLPAEGGVCIQAEDEMAAIGLCIGASMAGLKVMTATSGPGISLFSENISFAVGGEIPLVVVDVQRLGPSTGSATRGADGDIQFLRWGSSGGFPVIVLAPATASDCYVLIQHAFNLAEKYRCPVFFASNKEVGMTKESVDPENLDPPVPINRKRASPDMPFQPFAVSKDDPVPAFLPIGGRALVRQTSSTHGTDGYITTNPEDIAANCKRIKEKIDTQVDRFTFFDAYVEDRAKTLVVTWGVTARAALAVYKKLKLSGNPLSLLVLKTLWPVPERLIRSQASGHDDVFVTEMNPGLYKREIQRVLPEKTIRFFGQMDGRLITPEQLERAISNG